MAFRFSIPLPHFSSKKGKHENKHLKFNHILPHRRGREHPKDSPVCLPTTSSNVRSPRVKVKWSMYGFFARGSVRPTSLVPRPAKKNARERAYRFSVGVIKTAQTPPPNANYSSRPFRGRPPPRLPTWASSLQEANTAQGRRERRLPSVRPRMGGEKKRKKEN